MRIINTFRALKYMIGSVKIFYPEKVLKNKRVAVIGAADSAFEEKNGDWIDGFDFIIRINKAPHSLTDEKLSFLGSRTDILFHSFYENNESGGGPIDFELYKKQGVKFLINPNSSYKGLKTHLTYYKRNLNRKTTYILSRKYTRELTKNFCNWIPTIGFSALYTALNSHCKEVYITGFTFFKTPYADDYRDHFKDMKVNQKFIQSQGIHNPDLELQEFSRQLEQSNASKVTLDSALKHILTTMKQHNRENE